MSINILYLHGFNSSANSIKATQFKQYFANYLPHIRVHIPQIASQPKNAVQQIEELISQSPLQSWYFIGSSLGGYYATYFAEKYNRPAVVVNPAVKPYELLTEYYGEQINPYTDERYQVDNNFIEQLKSIDCETITFTNNFMLLTQTGDEVLDYLQGVEKYAYCRQIVEQGGDHSFINFEDKIADIVNFFQFA